VALSSAFFGRHPSQVAPELLGTYIVSTAGGVLTGGAIVETEAYLGGDDPGSHAATRGITKRNATMYGPPGSAYVYFTYGNHHMLNLVCEREGTAGAVLIRAIEPLWGLDEMTARRHGRPLVELCSGPGKLAAALGIDLSDNGVVLSHGRISVYYGSHPALSIATSGRIGLSAGHELELRYYMAGNPNVSRGRTGPPSTKRTRTGPEGNPR
jgi:DNA-3-methyladenine glycosylase